MPQAITRTEIDYTIVGIPLPDAPLSYFCLERCRCWIDDDSCIVLWPDELTGTASPTVFLDIYDDGKLFWVVREYYWDSTVELRQKTDAEYVDDLVHNPRQ